MTMGETDCKAAPGNFGGDEYLHYLDLGDHLTNTYICENISNYILYIWLFQ